MSAPRTLDKRAAALRAEAVREILAAGLLLSGASTGAAFHGAVYSHPKAALLAIRRAEARLARAKAALGKWVKP